jgi:hypothetical protein
MDSAFNCHNIAKHTEVYLGELRFDVNSTGNAKRVLQWYSKCYCVASVTKMFILKGVQTIHR